MQDHIDNPPDPSALVESLRAFGYSFDDAVCDVIDNSIAAGARRIYVDFTWLGRKSVLTITDDGSGMNREQLVQAMKLGARSPVEERAPNDLGRFGLGLKTASFSQCRRLAVSSRAADSGVSHAVWDLDHIALTSAWQMGTSVETSEDRASEMLLAGSGTIVRWGGMDRFVGDVDADDEAARDAALRRLEELNGSLALVYSDWLQGRNRVEIRVNGNAVEPWDPFLRHHVATQELPTEHVHAGAGRTITVTPYVLPHHHRLTTEEHRAASGPDGWNAHQGFYVYRGKRLLVSGGWLGLGVKAEEHYKLARVRIDLENEDDHDWQIDVRKQQAEVPQALRKDLQRIARSARSRASEVYRARGKVLRSKSTEDRSFVWQQKSVHGHKRFVVNRRHPLVQELRSSSPVPSLVTSLLHLIEGSVPIVDIAIAHHEENEEQTDPFSHVSTKDLLAVARNLFHAISKTTAPGVALKEVAALDPCATHPELIALLEEELSDDR